MKVKKPKLLSRYKPYVVSVSLILTFSLLIGHLLIMGIRNYFTEQMSTEVYRLVDSYANMINKLSEAETVINDLINQRLISATNIVIDSQSSITDEKLEQIAKDTLIDKIYWYNPKGKVVASVKGEYLGWQMYPEHSSFKFANGKAEEMIENVRKDSDSPDYYKYAYKKAANGYFVQVAVKAENIENITNKFNIESLIDELKKEKRIKAVYFTEKLDDRKNSETKLIAGASRFSSLEESEDTTFSVKDSYVETFDRKEKTYEIALPIYASDKLIGYLNVVHLVEDTEAIIRSSSVAGLVIVLIGSTTTAVFMIYTYKRKNELLNLLYYDHLTGLPNKKFLNEFLFKKLSDVTVENKALFLINVSKFRNINLLFGFESGDKVLVKIVDRMKRNLSEKSKLFRFSDDRFVMYIDSYENTNHLVSSCQRIIDSFKDHFEIAEISKVIDVKVGAIELSEKYSNPDGILKDVSIALDNIGEVQNNSFCFFNESMEEKLKRVEAVEEEIRKAIKDNREDLIYLVYQPQVDIKSGKIIGFEALARMKCERLGYISPNEFIKIAEERQLIIPLGEIVMKKAFDFQSTMERLVCTDSKIAINLSNIQLMWDYIISKTVNLISKAQINPFNIELEVTESIFNDNYQQINKTLEEFKSHGIKIAIDDFGTGYSSLSKIRELNIDSLKIDKSFTDKILNTEKPLISDMVSLGHRLGLAVVVEGIEEEFQKNYLIEHGCKIAQGYLFGKPLSESDALNLMKANRGII